MPLRALLLTVVAMVAVAAIAGPATQVTADLLPAVSVPYMLRGYFLAGSPLPDREAPGGFAVSSNLPHKLDREYPPTPSV